MRQLLLLAALAALSCSAPADKGPLSSSKEGELKTYFTAQMKKIDSTLKLDSFRLIRVDTLTQRDMYANMILQLNPQKDDIIQDMRRILEEMKYNAKMVNLTNGLSSTLYRTYKSDLDDGKEKMDQKQLEAKMLSNRYDSLQVLYEKSDSLTPTHFDAVVLYQIRKKDMSVEKDTGHLLLNKDLNIIDRSKYGVQ